MRENLEFSCVYSFALPPYPPAGSPCGLGPQASLCKNAGEVHRAQRRARARSTEEPWKCQVERSGYIWPLPSSLLLLLCPRNLLVTIFIAEWLSSFRCGAWLSFPKLPYAYMSLPHVLPRSLTFFPCASLPPFPEVQPSGPYSRISLPAPLCPTLSMNLTASQRAHMYPELRGLRRGGTHHGTATAVSHTLGSVGSMAASLRPPQGPGFWSLVLSSAPS